MNVSVTGWWVRRRWQGFHRRRRVLQSGAHRVCDALEHGRDVRAHELESDDRDDGHQGQDQAVLDHCLAVLALDLQPGAEVHNEVTHDFLLGALPLSATSLPGAATLAFARGTQRA